MSLTPGIRTREALASLHFTQTEYHQYLGFIPFIGVERSIVD